MRIKKYLVWLLSLVLLLQVSPVLAAPQIATDARVSYDTSGKITVTISASQELSSSEQAEHRQNEAVYNIVRYTVSVENDDHEYLVADGGYTDASGRAEVTYDISPSANSGKYGWVCVVDGTRYDGKFRHINPMQAAPAIASLNGGADLSDVISTYSNELGITYAEFSAVSGLEKWYDTYVEGYENLTAAEFLDVYTRAEVKATIINSQSDDVTNALIKENEKLIGFEYSRLEAESEAVRRDAISLLTAGESSANSLAKEIEICIGLSKLNNNRNSAWNVYEDILVNTYANAFGIDVNAYNNKSNKSDIIKSVMNGEYTSLNSLLSSFNNALTNIGNGPTDNDNSGTESGSAISGNAPVSLPDVKPTVSVDSESIFSDVAIDHWAYQYIAAMNASGIVQGDNGRFEPDRNVTRAEFAKIVQTAFYPNETAPEHGFTDVTSSDWYAESVAILASKGIINGVSDGIFEPNSNIKRQDMAVMFSRLADNLKLTMASGSGDIGDIDAVSDYAVDAVKKLVGAEIISGDDYGNFAPQAMLTRAQVCKLVYVFKKYVNEKQTVPSDDFKMTDYELLSSVLSYVGISDNFESENEITAQEVENILAKLVPGMNAQTLEDQYASVSSNKAAERLLKMMGYEAVIDSFGGYYTQALNIGLFDNCPSSNAPMTKKQFYTMLFDAVRLPLCVIDNGKVSYSDDSILSKYHNIYKDSGDVTANRFTAVSSNDYTAKDRIKIDNVSYKMKEMNSELLLGRKVEFYYKSAKGDNPEIVSIRVDESGYKELIIKNEDIVSISGNTINYKNSNNATKKVTLTNGYDLIVNNAYISDFESLNDFVSQDGTVTLINNDGSGWNLAIIKNYETMIASGISSTENTIYTNKGNISYNDLDEDVCITIMLATADGEIREAEFDEIKSNSVLSVCRSRNGRYLYIISSDKTVDERILSKSKDMLISAKGVEYEVCNGVSVSEIEFGILYTLYLDHNGRVAKYTTDEKQYEYGYIVNAWESEDGNSIGFTFVTPTGVKKLTTKDTVSVNGQKLSSVVALDNFIEGDEVQRQLVKYMLDTDGYVKYLVTASTSGTAADDKLILNEKDVTMKYANRMESMDRRYLISDAFVLGIPNGYEADASRYVIGHSFANFANQTVDIYDTDDDMYAGVMIYKTNSNAYEPEIRETSNIGIIKNIISGIDGDGKETDMLEIYTNGGYKNYAISTLYENYVSYFDENPTIEPGDVILFETNTYGDISGLIKRFDYSAKSVPDQSKGAYEMCCGTVYSKTDKFMTLVSGNNYDFTNRTVVPLDSSKTYIVTVVTNADGSFTIERIESGLSMDINPLRDSSGTASFAFSHTNYHGTLMSNVIYNIKQYN